jgi:hypothetical protein
MATTSDRERQREREAEELAVGPLLARANLLRMRGQWDEAVASCMAALRKAPHSAAAHLLLGEIYEAQGKVDDAVPWYTMAVDHDPGNAAAREKLARLEEMQRVRLRAQTAPPPGTAPKREKTIERTMQWWDQMFPPGQSDAIARMIFVVCGVIAALLIISAGVVYFVVLPNQRSQNYPVPTLNAPSAPVVMAPPETPPTPVQSSPAARRPAPSPGPSATPAAPSSGPVEDVRLHQAVAASSSSLFTLLTTRRETARNAALLEIALPTVAEGTEQTKERIVRAAALAAKAANGADPRITSVSIRAGISVALPQNPRETQIIPVFAGEIPGGTLQGVEPMSADLASLLSRFASLTWTPLPGGALGPGNTSPAGPNPPGMPGGTNYPPAGLPQNPGDTRGNSASSGGASSVSPTP